MSKWQPIETAPRRCEVLTFGPLKDGSGYYYIVQKFHEGRHSRWPSDWMHNTLTPTHWMPLPEPPEGAA